MKSLEERIFFLVSQASQLEAWVGSYDASALRRWLNAELGDERRLEQWVDGSRVVACGSVLHVVSGNTPHAAFQSVFRAILIGCRSYVKLPTGGLAEFEQWAKSVQGELGELLEWRRDLPEEWRKPETAVVYGGAESINWFREWLPKATKIIEHGPKLSAAFVFEEKEGLTAGLAEDVMRFGQRGCLSVQIIYLQGDIAGFCGRMAFAMRQYSELNGRVPGSLSEAGQVRNERELTRFRIANGAAVKMWESEASTDWTVVCDEENPFLRAGPLNGFVRVVPMPKVISQQSLGEEVRYLSTAVVEPIAEEWRLEGIGPPRICAAGQAQEPGIFWHPDGEMPLAGLVRWRDLG
ncbi:MAG: hypothetical protein H7Y36_06125 [Armatimonadetes bacterium]|nr:hypothetical protein [Akkermansiaceae bacterium]